ncbi:MAG TPA: SufD family Fe-S cluster assembly protein, partial [Desulfobacteraceae bacterium]|nr:SufD family Fe-S cluster assembly protein [Desulfobacteraceae bacterium]
MRELKNSINVNLENYKVDAKEHKYIDKLSRIESEDKKKMLNVGIDTDEKNRTGTFIQKDKSVIHCKAAQDGIEVTSMTDAVRNHKWLGDYMWKSILPDTDKFTLYASENPYEGYFIRSLPGINAKDPVQSCLYITKDGFSQNVHNIVIAEEDSNIHIITGCAAAPHLLSGLHVGISEFYVKRGATLIFTMFHDWGEKVNVRPRTVINVEEGGTIVSNYIFMGSVGSLQMYPTTYLNGKEAVARFNSILVARQGSFLDVGSRVVLNAPGSRAEIISRGITTGGSIIARGDLVGKAPGIKAHL